MTSTLTAEYLLLITPDNSTYEKIMVLKEQFASAFDCPQALKSLPHITLINYTHSVNREESIQSYLLRKTQNIFPFRVEVSNFGQFPSHTIFANVANPNPINDAVKQLKQNTKILKISKDTSPFFCNNPHITIARKLVHWQFEKGWQEWQYQHFRTSFEVKELKLLRKNIGTGKYQEIMTLPLLGKATDSTQGCLF